MGDAVTLLNGYPVKLINNGDGSYSLSTVNEINKSNAAGQAYDPVRDVRKVIPYNIYKTLQNGVSAPANGKQLDIAANGIVGVHVIGDSSNSARTIIFEASLSGADTDWVPVLGTNKTTDAMATQTTGKNELWTFELKGIKFFRTRISAMTGGTLTVFAQTGV